MEKETSRKRPEENQKFVFKRALKYMKNALKSKIPTKAKKKLLEAFFMDYYFKDVSEREKIPLEHFNHPKDSNKRPLVNFAVPKTINNQFISTIFKSEKFVKDFIIYLNAKFNKDYEEIINFKLTFLINRWEEQLNNGQEFQTELNDICLYVEKNKKCKLPWDFIEIQEAKSYALSLLNWL